MALRFSIEFEFKSVGVCRGRKTGDKADNPSEQGREPCVNKLNPHMTRGSGNRTRTTLVRGGRSHHCAPSLLPSFHGSVAPDNSRVLTVKLWRETSLVAYSTDKRSICFSSLRVSRTSANPGLSKRWRR